MMRSSADRRTRASPSTTSAPAARTSRDRRTENQPSGSPVASRYADPESCATRQPPLRRSSRRAAAVATERMKELAEPKRREGAVATGGDKDYPIVLDGDDGNDETEGEEIPAQGFASSRASVTAAPSPGQDEPFMCPICLDTPDQCDDIATISGCDHRFCYDCIDRWAGTENKCPLCKARFRTITRAVAPEVAAASMPAADTPSIRGSLKRKIDGTEVASSADTVIPGRRSRRRIETAVTSLGTSPAEAAVRVSSRTVEDRNQISTSTISMDGALLNQIIFQTLARAMNRDAGAEPSGLNARISARGATFRVRTGNGHVIQMVFGRRSDSDDEEGDGVSSENESPSDDGEVPTIFLDDVDEN